MNLVLHSQRLTMTPFDAADVDLAVELFTDPEVTRFAGGVLKADDIRRESSNTIRRGGDGHIGVWCISDRETGEKYGTVALLPIPVEDKHTDYSLVVPGEMPDGDIEIGYFLKRSVWGRGYATEACRRLLRFVFQETSLEEVVATFDKSNLASRNVLEKAGFIDCGTMRCYGSDGINFRISRDDWSRLQST